MGPRFTCVRAIKHCGLSCLSMRARLGWPRSGLGPASAEGAVCSFGATLSPSERRRPSPQVDAGVAGGDASRLGRRLCASVRTSLQPHSAMKHTGAVQLRLLMHCA